MPQPCRTNQATHYINRRCKIPYAGIPIPAAAVIRINFPRGESADDLRHQRDVIAEWSRLSYGWMGRTPDYKAALWLRCLGANPALYGQFTERPQLAYTRYSGDWPVLLTMLIVVRPRPNPPTK